MVGLHPNLPPDVVVDLFTPETGICKVRCSQYNTLELRQLSDEIAVSNP